MTKSTLRQAYDILIKVYKDNTYLNLLMKKNSHAGVAKIVYGVLEKHYELNYIIDSLAEKKPKLNIRVMLLIASYCLLYLNTPYNVVLNGISELAQSLGKSALKPFLAAITKKIDEKNYQLPKKNNKEYMEVKYNLPSFLVGLFRKDYPNNFEEIINAKSYDRVHIIAKCGDKTVLEAEPTAIKTQTGYFVKNNKEISLLSFLGKATYMSYGSSLIAQSIPIGCGEKLLDTCAAPGGKSVFLAERGAKVTSCDIHEHRVKLISDYAKRMNTKLDNICKRDATKYYEKWQEHFDIVLVDAPCSGLGVLETRRDVIFNRTYQDILNLASLQLTILNNVKNYVKKGGLLVYSTCTIFSMENGDNVEKFLQQNNDFRLEKIELPYQNDGTIQFLPDGKGMGGFYLCHMRRI
ncbi:MAG: methyltransferase domain-containing protein [Clostridiales bacterium]|nr:methyltransferase domain-containing protein [Clostridiales bacterium]